MAEFAVAVLSLVACVFATSAIVKLRGPGAYRAFRAGIRGTGLLPERLLRAAVAMLAGAEVATAAGLACAAAAFAVAGPGMLLLAEAALAAAAALTAVLALGVAVVLRRGIRAPCACFGIRSDQPIGPVHLVRNLALLAVEGGGLAACALSAGRPAPVGLIVAAVAGLAAAMLLIRLDDLVALVAPIQPSKGAAPMVRRPDAGPADAS